MIGAFCYKFNNNIFAKIYPAGKYDSIEWANGFQKLEHSEYIFFNYKETEACESQEIIIENPVDQSFCLRLRETVRYCCRICGDGQTPEELNKYLPLFINENNKFLKIDKDIDSLSFQFVNYLGYCHLLFPVDNTKIQIEIVPNKIDYEDDYIKLTESIAEECAALLLDYSGVTFTKFTHSNEDANLLEQFIFLRQFCYSDNILSLFESIKRNPDRNLEQEEILQSFGSAPPSPKFFTNPFSYSRGWQQIGGFNLPQEISITRKYDNLNTPANRFIKHALKYFQEKCEKLILYFENKSKEQENKKQTECVNEAKRISSLIDDILLDSFFDDVTELDIMPQNNQVLQKREGYSQIFNAFSMVDLALQLDWKGKDDIYNGESKNTALLYEYWLFFKLMECVSEVFDVPAVEKKCLISQDADGINLELRQGHTKMIHGTTTAGNRRLNINLYYNRTFSHTDDIYSSGSWTMNMRPDYTLSIWPGELSEAEAEREDAIVHIHFDAKYRLNKIIIEDKEIDLESSEKELQNEKEDREIDIYKRGDLLKMHAYKDAIRRTGGAYVLYPGTEKKIRKGFHEIIPGLGAFCIAPGHEDEQIPALKRFLRKIVDHFMDRTSQREKVAVAEHEIHSTPPNPFYEMFPEPYGNSVFPDSVRVLLGCYKNQEHLEWILKTGKYNIRCGGNRDGAVELEDTFINFKYLLLYDMADYSVKYILKMTKAHPVVITDTMLAAMDYPEPTPGQLYMLYDVSKEAVEPELLDRPWFIESFVKGKNGAPQTVLYTNLFDTGSHL